MDDKLKKLQAQYKDVPIPEELETMIERNLQHRPHKKKRKLPTFLIAAAAAVILSKWHREADSS